MNEMKLKFPDVLEDPEMEKYCFANQMEFILYSAKRKKEGGFRGIIWLASEEYQTLFNKGYDLFDKGRYPEAIRVLQDALKLNPVGLDARFELCECYLALGLVPGARQILLDMQDYLVEPFYIARFYRRMGFIAAERRDFRLAAACLLYSLKFEREEAYVRNELAYVFQCAGRTFKVYDPRLVIRKAGLPLLKALYSEEESSSAEGEG